MSKVLKDSITDSISLHLENTRGHYEYYSDMVDQLLEEDNERREDYILADRIEEDITKRFEDLTHGPSENTDLLASEVLSTSLRYVDWDKIALSFIPDNAELSGRFTDGKKAIEIKREVY